MLELYGLQRKISTVSYYGLSGDNFVFGYAAVTPVLPRIAFTKLTRGQNPAAYLHSHRFGVYFAFILLRYITKGGTGMNDYE
jgi:hypothetical protein